MSFFKSLVFPIYSPSFYKEAVNNGLGKAISFFFLFLIFSFFDGMGGMAIVAAWWGIWHIISGLTLSFYWSKFGTTSTT